MAQELSNNNTFISFAFSSQDINVNEICIALELLRSPPIAVNKRYPKRSSRSKMVSLLSLDYDVSSGEAEDKQEAYSEGTYSQGTHSEETYSEPEAEMTDSEKDEEETYLEYAEKRYNNNRNRTKTRKLYTKVRNTRPLQYGRVCSRCGVKCTSQWRRIGENTACNACGLKYKKFRDLIM
jgi:hypothetical protein